MKKYDQCRPVLTRLAPVLASIVLLVPYVNAAQAKNCSSPITVESGDTLSGIAHRCGSSVSALLANNPHIEESGAVRIGESVYLPAQSSLFSAAQLDDMLAPIALHPDVLLAEMLPAATYPLEIVQAARWRERNKNSEVSSEEAWADSVKALTRYPEVLAQMDEDIEWTAQVGEAFLAQPDDVFASIQRLRRRADAAGHLKDNEVQDIVTEPASQGSETIIRIVHADPHYVYVPRYDPHYVYSSSAHNHHHYNGVHFGIGFLLGGWLHHTLDWHHRHLFYQPYHATAYSRYYRYRHYRPYTYYNRSVVGYGHSPYRGLRWRHNAHRYNSYARTVNNNGGVYQGHRYQGHGYHARRNAGERRSINGRLNRPTSNENRALNRDARRDSDQRVAGNRGSQRHRAADMKTELWKGDKSARNSRTAASNNRTSGQSMANRLKRSESAGAVSKRSASERATRRNIEQRLARTNSRATTRQAGVQRATRPDRLQRSDRTSVQRSTRQRTAAPRSQVRSSAPRSRPAAQSATRSQPERSSRPQSRPERVTRSEPRRSQASSRASRPSSRASSNRRLETR